MFGNVSNHVVIGVELRRRNVAAGKNFLLPIVADCGDRSLEHAFRESASNAGIEALIDRADQRAVAPASLLFQECGSHELTTRGADRVLQIHDQPKVRRGWRGDYRAATQA